MASTFYGLQIAYSGLNAYQAALNTTGHNISNVETEGYCRQYVNQTAADALRTYTNAGMQGGGVTVTGIDQMRNIYYDYKYWDNNAKLGETGTQYYYLLQIENYFKGNMDVDDAAKAADDFSSLFTNMFNALEEVKKTPSDNSCRNQFISTAQSFADYFNSTYTSLQRLQEDCNLEIKAKVSEINSIAEKIASLNKQINVIEGNGNKANDLRDKRALLIDQLSSIVPTKVEEIPIVDSNNPDRNTGMYTYSVSIAGQTLVYGKDYNTLLVKPRDAKSAANQTDVQGLYDLEWSNGLEFSASNEQMGGELKALFDIRDGNNKENFQGIIKSIDQDARTFTISSDDVLVDAYKSVYGINIAEQGIITVNNVKLAYDSFSFNEDGSYTFHLTEGSTGVAPSLVGAKAAVGESVDYMGIPYYMSQMNEFVRKFAEVFNNIHQGNEDLNGNTVGYFFSGIDPVDGVELEFDEPVGTGTDSYYRLTAANFVVRDEYVKDPSRLATTGTISEGVEQVDVLQKLSGIKDMAGFYNGGTAGEFLECILTDIALDTQAAKTMSSNYEEISKMIEQQRLSISGVDNDEEALNLIKYQNAYNLSAKMMSVMTEIYDRLILETGV